MDERVRKYYEMKGTWLIFKGTNFHSDFFVINETYFIKEVFSYNNICNRDHPELDIRFRVLRNNYPYGFILSIDNLKNFYTKSELRAKKLENLHGTT